MLKIKRDDEVIILAGKDKGKRGKVRRVLDNNKLIVSGINMVKKHTKPNPQAGVAGGIVERRHRFRSPTSRSSTLAAARLIVWVLRWKGSARCVSSNPVARQLTPEPFWLRVSRD